MGERLSQGAVQGYFNVKTRKLKVRKYKQDRLKQMADDLIMEAAEVLKTEEQSVILAVPDEFNARDTDIHVIVIESEIRWKPSHPFTETLTGHQLTQHFPLPA